MRCLLALSRLAIGGEGMQGNPRTPFELDSIARQKRESEVRRAEIEALADRDPETGARERHPRGLLDRVKLALRRRRSSR